MRFSFTRDYSTGGKRRAREDEIQPTTEEKLKVFEEEYGATARRILGEESGEIVIPRVHKITNGDHEDNVVETPKDLESEILLDFYNRTVTTLDRYKGESGDIPSEARESVRHAIFLAARECWDKRDIITGLAQKGTAEKTLTDIIKTRQRQKKRQELNPDQADCLILIDLDYFKQINDKFGHDVGDLALRTVGDKLKQMFRAEDILVRHGGDELIVIMRDVAKKKSPTVARDKFNELKDTEITFDYHGEQKTQQLSFSCAAVEIAANQITEGTTPEQIIKLADKGLQIVKRHGRNAIAFSTISGSSMTLYGRDGEVEDIHNVDNYLRNSSSGVIGLNESRYGDQDPS